MIVVVTHKPLIMIVVGEMVMTEMIMIVVVVMVMTAMIMIVVVVMVMTVDSMQAGHSGNVAQPTIDVIAAVPAGRSVLAGSQH